jgi:integrase
MDESTATVPRKARRRANGEGSIYKDASGRWRGAVTWTDSEGRTQRRTVSAVLRNDAKRRLGVLRAELDRGLEPATTEMVAEYLGRWLSTGRTTIRPASWRQREQNVRLYLTPALGRLTLAKLTPADVERMTDAMIARGLSPTTAIGARITLRKAIADAMRNELVYRNAAALARPPRKVRVDLQYLDRDAMRRLLTACDGHELGPIVVLAATTGLRQSELLGLAWSDVDLMAGRLSVRHSMARNWTGGYSLAEPKTTRSRRTIHLPALAVDALRVEQASQAERQAIAGDRWQDRDGLAFTDAAGRPLRGTAVTHDFQKLLEAADLPRIPFHALRHSTATTLLAAGVPLTVISDALGHSTLSITADLYTAVVPELRRDAADAMDRALGGGR